MDAKKQAEQAMKEERFADAARLYLQASQPYEAALAFQKGRSLKECLDALLKVPRTSVNYRAACVHATRVAGLLGEKLTRLAPLVAGFLETSPTTHAEATAMKELAETRAGVDGSDLAHEHRSVALVAQDVAQRGGDGRRGEAGGGHLVEQGLEEVMVAAVDERDVHGRLAQRAHRPEAGETAADHHDFLSFCHMRRT